MIEQDTIRLLRECDAGIKMGVSAIDEVLKYVRDEELKQMLEANMHEHERIQNTANDLLKEYNDEGKEPNPMAKGISWMKTNVKLTFSESDNTIADIITDGCNMGVKSLSKYLNQYEAADEKSKDLAKKLISIEEDLAVNIRKFL